MKASPDFFRRAHGFLTLEEGVEVFYKVNRPWVQQAERSIRWDDPALAIEWPLPEGCKPLLSPKDEAAPLLSELFAAEAKEEVLA